MGVRISKGDPLWDALYQLWKRQPSEPGWVTLAGGELYKVLHPSDDEIIFEKQSGLDDMYSSMTKGMPG